MDETRIQEEINKYKKFKKVDGGTYRKVNQFLRKRTYITAREWALARLCTDFRTTGGAEMTFIGQHLPELVPFMEDTYSPQAVNQARNSFKKKVRKASATFFYGAMCGFFTTDELDDLLFEASEVARFLLEVEGTTLDIDEEIDIEDRITKVMRSVGETAKTILKNRVMVAEQDQDTHASLEKPEKRQAALDARLSVKAIRRKRKRTFTEESRPLSHNMQEETGTGKPEAPSVPDTPQQPADVPEIVTGKNSSRTKDLDEGSAHGDPPLLPVENEAEHDTGAIQQ
ncbi:MAG: DUF5806 family protein [Methanoregula sp.]|nr:MAG: DUF5806 family protein [Methanoregula sp.]